MLDLAYQYFEGFFSSAAGSLALTSVVLGIFLFFRMSVKLLDSETRYKVAIFGLPRSGKTTLISMLFYSLMQERLPGKAVVGGEGTLRRITAFIESIRRGDNLGPTTDRDVYSFRFVYKPARKFFGRFDVEVADFPGEYSASLGENAALQLNIQKVENHLSKLTNIDDEELRSAMLNLMEERRRARSNRVADPEPGFEGMSNLYDREYNSYILSSDKYLIVIDLEAAIRDPELIPLLEAKIFSAVISIAERATGYGKPLHKKDAAIVFSKSDCIANSSLFSRIKSRAADSEAIQFGSLRDEETDLEFFSQYTNWVLKEFSETIAIVSSNFRDVDLFFHSSYMRTEPFLTTERDLMRFILPK